MKNTCSCLHFGTPNLAAAILTDFFSFLTASMAFSKEALAHFLRIPLFLGRFGIVVGESKPEGFNTNHRAEQTLLPLACKSGWWLR